MLTGCFTRVGREASFRIELLSGGAASMIGVPADPSLCPAIV